MIPKYNRAIVKWNNSLGALLCNGCRTIVAEGFDHEDVEHFCADCRASLSFVAGPESLRESVVCRIRQIAEGRIAIRAECHTDEEIGEPAMITKPIVVRVALAQNWLVAFDSVWTETFGIATHDISGQIDNDLVEIRHVSSDWKERRIACRRFAHRFVENGGNWAIGGAWAMLGIDPSALPSVRTGDDELLYGIAMVGLATVIAEWPAHLNRAFGKAVYGWRFLDQYGRLAHQTGENDPIIVAQAIGSPITVDGTELWTWASTWAERR